MMSPRAERDQHDGTADEHGNAGTVDDAGEDVASQFVGSEPVRVRRRTEAIGKMDGGRILWRDQGANIAHKTKRITSTTPIAASGLWRALLLIRRLIGMAVVDTAHYLNRSSAGFRRSTPRQITRREAVGWRLAYAMDGEGGRTISGITALHSITSQSRKSVRVVTGTLANVGDQHGTENPGEIPRL